MRVGIVADDGAVASGLERLFARRASLDVVRALSAGGGAAQDALPAGPAPDLLVIDVWPPSAGRAEALCRQWHARAPAAAIVAIVHRPTRELLAQIRAAGGTGLWPKDDVRALPDFALGLTRGAPAEGAP